MARLRQAERGVMSSFMTLRYKQMIVHWSSYCKCLNVSEHFWICRLSLFCFLHPLRRIHHGTGSWGICSWRVPQNPVDPSGKSLSEYCRRESAECSLHFFPSKGVTLFFSLVIVHILICSKFLQFKTTTTTAYVYISNPSFINKSIKWT